MEQKLTIIILFICLSVILTGCINASPTKNKSDADTDIDVDTDVDVDIDTDTADWQTYQNNEQGFSFKYPQGLTYLQEKNDRLPPDMLFSVSFDKKNAEYNNAIDFNIFKESIDDITKNSSLTQKEYQKITINGIKWVKIVNWDKDTHMMFIDYFTNNGKATYSLGCIYSRNDGATINKRVDVLKKIVESFQLKN